MSLKVANRPMSEMKDGPTKSILPGEMWIPNVQEMVKIHPELVPEMYIRNLTITANAKRFQPAEIPIIDFALLKNGSKEELLKLDMACKDWGFFQLKKGVPTQLMQEMKDATAAFLRLPIREKEKYAMPKQQNMQGYGHIQMPNKEHKLDWSDSLFLLAQPAHSRDLSFWPKIPKGYKEIIDKYSREVNQVGVELLNYLSVIMRKETPAVLGSPVYFLANYYPPCSKADRVLCVTPHFDSNSMTLVMQDQDDVTELQIMHKGEWLPVPPMQNALVCDIGDFIEKWSNGRYKSIEHRVVANKTKVRSVHEVILLPSTKPITVQDFVEGLRRPGSSN